jgi:amidase
MVITTEGIRFSDRITLPHESFIGTLSPQIEAVSSLQPDYWGGNMDFPDVAPGALVYFQIQHDSAYLCLGDCDGRQDDEELCVAVEMPAKAAIHVVVIKNWSIPGVRLETADFIMSVGSARPMEAVALMAYRELIGWLVSDDGFEQSEAYLLCTQARRMRVGNMVDPNMRLVPRCSNPISPRETAKRELE